MFSGEARAGECEASGPMKERGRASDDFGRFGSTSWGRLSAVVRLEASGSECPLMMWWGNPTLAATALPLH
jgi:hypothetical protein